ncbi:MAG: hypothetical protein V4534_01655 [Myxococcota bacterium]
MDKLIPRTVSTQSEPASESDEAKSPRTSEEYFTDAFEGSSSSEELEHQLPPSMEAGFERVSALWDKEFPQFPKPDPALAHAGLMKADIISPGKFLTPPEYEYDAESSFNHGMGQEAAELAHAPILKPTPAVLKARLDEIAKTRRYLAYAAEGNEYVLHGQPIEEASKEWGAHVMDDMSEGSRHGYLAQAARERISTRYQVFGHVEVGNETIELSSIDMLPGVLDGLAMHHPFNADAIKIKNHALEMLAAAFCVEPWDLDQIAASYRLLCHGTPYVNGTPSIIETFIDGMLRSRGWALPSKKSEPFWNAVMHDDEDGPYTWQHFMRNFESPETTSSPIAT